MNRRKALMDMDGVIANFADACIRAHGRSDTPESLTGIDWAKLWGMTPEEFWRPMQGADFWANIEPYPWAAEFYVRVSEMFEVTICTSPSRDKKCHEGKLAWLEKHLGIMVEDTMIGRKKVLLAHPLHILIDDTPAHVDDFQMAGGLSIGFKQPWNRFTDDWQGVLQVLEGLAA